MQLKINYRINFIFIYNIKKTDNSLKIIIISIIFLSIIVKLIDYLTILLFNFYFILNSIIKLLFLMLFAFFNYLLFLKNYFIN